MKDNEIKHCKVNKLKRIKKDVHKNVLLIGLPNVGKSVIFNKLTALDVSIANYAGTTVEVVSGKAKFNKYNTKKHPQTENVKDDNCDEIIITDVPGTYSLNATNQAEKIAIDMLNQRNINLVVVVIDANNLESSIYLLLQILEKKLPTIAILNRIDIAKNKHKYINIEFLQNELGIEIIPCIAIDNVGIEEVKNKISEIVYKKIYLRKTNKYNSTWENSEHLTNIASEKINEHKKSIIENESNNTTTKNNKTSFKNKLINSDILINPKTGVPIAILILLILFGFIVGVGMGLRRFILLPFFRELIFPYIRIGIQSIIPDGTIQNILIGEYGFLIKGIEWPITLVLPYVLSFYAAFSFLEDSGYLTRLGVLLDGLFNKIGLSGINIIPILLGYGCAIPAIAATRALNTTKEKIIVSTLISLTVPCISQTGAFISLLSTKSLWLVFWLFILSFVVLVISGHLLNKFLKGDKVSTLIVEIPELLVPKVSILLKKIWIRFKSYITNGAVMMFYAIAIASILYEIGLFDIIGRFMSPIVSGWLKLPSEASVPLILGIVRRELTILPLLDMNLNTLQLFTGAVMGLFYVPCIAVIVMLMKEFNIKIASGVLALTLITSFLLGGIIARLDIFIL